MTDERRLEYTICSEILCYEEWYSRSEFPDADDEVNEAAEHRNRTRDMEESQTLYWADGRVPDRI